MLPKPIILVVDDNKDIRELLQMTLEREGYVVKRAKNAVNAKIKAKKYHPRLILLDIMMPGQDGISLCKELRTLLGKEVRIVLLTALQEENSEVAAFEAGADDFINKPIKKRALTHRIAALLQRKSSLPMKDPLEVGGFLIDPTSHSIYRGEEQLVPLRPREFELFYFLAQHPGRYFSRDVLVEKVWGEDTYVTPRTVDVHVRHIREKIGPNCISTRQGVGYAFKL